MENPTLSPLGRRRPGDGNGSDLGEAFGSKRRLSGHTALGVETVMRMGGVLVAGQSRSALSLVVVCRPLFNRVANLDRLATEEGEHAGYKECCDQRTNVTHRINYIRASDPAPKQGLAEKRLVFVHSPARLRRPLSSGWR